MISNSLEDLKQKFDQKLKLSTNVIDEMYSILSDLLYNIFSMLQLDDRIGSKIRSKFFDIETGEEKFLIVQLADIFDQITNSNHNLTEKKSVEMQIFNKFLSIECGKLILKNSFTDQLKTQTGKTEKFEKENCEKIR